LILLPAQKTDNCLADFSTTIRSIVVFGGKGFQLWCA
jgi:hypothetical protein